MAPATSRSSSGNSRARRPWMVDSTAAAALGVQEARSRATTVRKCRERSVSGSMEYVGCSGTRARAETQSCADTGRRKAAGTTPTISTGSPSSKSVRRSTPGSAPKCDRHSDSESTAARGPGGPGSITRPSSGRAWSTWKKSAETSAPSTRSGSPSVATLNPRALTAAIDSKGPPSAFQERKSAPVTVRRVPRPSDCQANTSRSSPGYGRGLQKSASATSRTVSVAPSPRPSTATVRARKPRRRDSRAASAATACRG